MDKKTKRGSSKKANKKIMLEQAPKFNKNNFKGSFKEKVESKVMTNFSFSDSSKKIQTPLDFLYSHLEKEELSVKDIMKKFDLKKEQALEWCQILADRNLAELSYPIFGQPVLKIKKEDLS